MSDDIVTRLREGYGQGCKCYAHCYCECGCDAEWAEHYIKEAADEIERLRIKCEKWRKLAHLAHECILYGERSVGEFLDMYEATIRGGHA